MKKMVGSHPLCDQTMYVVGFYHYRHSTIHEITNLKSFLKNLKRLFIESYQFGET